jgi:4-diphosphocytidyl-2-C-methyl-D-erythritol kinase
MQLALKSPAKINLALHVLGRREDGYHNVETLMAKIDLWDELTFELLDQPIFKISCPKHPDLETADNLVLRAARSVLPASKGVAVHLTKNIPFGAGLGGGSGNAAIAIDAMDQLAGLQLTQSQKMEAAAKIGADVPFFLLPECAALARGIGTELTPIPNFIQLPLVLVVPPFQISTEWAYKNLQEIHWSQPLNRNALTLSVGNDKKKSDSVRWEEKDQVTDLLHNDLESVATKTHSAVQAIKDELLKLGALGALMSGSGSSVFGIFDSVQASEQACTELESDKTLWVRALTTLTTQGMRRENGNHQH